jgi:hypothetical protein
MKEDNSYPFGEITQSIFREGYNKSDLKHTPTAFEYYKIYKDGIVFFNRNIPKDVRK